MLGPSGGLFFLGGEAVSEESTILERLKGLETEQKNVQKSLDEMKGSMKELADTFSRFMTQQATLASLQSNGISGTAENVSRNTKSR